VARLWSVLPFLLEHRKSHAGEPLAFASLGLSDMEAFFSSLTQAQWSNANVYGLEYLLLRLDQESLAQGRLVTAVQLFDCHGIRLQHVMPRVFHRLKDAVQLPDRYYPELFSQIVAFNILPIAVRAYELIRPLLSKAIQERIRLATPARSEGLPLSLAPPSSLPACYGGSLAQLPEDVAAALGIDKLGAGCLAGASGGSLFRGEPAHLGKYHSTPYDAALHGSAWPPARSSSRDWEWRRSSSR